MKKEFLVAVFSPNDPRPWVRSENLDMMLDHEARLLEALKTRGFSIIRGGDGFRARTR